VLGGAEESVYVLAEALVRHGHVVQIVGSYEDPHGVFPSRRDELLQHLRRGGRPAEVIGSGDVRYAWHGVTCVATTQERVEVAARGFLAEADRVFVALEGSDDLARLAGPSRTVGWLHAASAVALSPLRARPRHALATSRFVLGHARAAAGSDAAVLHFPPPFRPVEGKRVIDANVRTITMVNPVPAKGGELVAELTLAMPDITFTLVEGWWAVPGWERCPNVTYLPRRASLSDVYSGTAVLLVPSIVADAGPRVIVEAGLHGIPSVGSEVGGIAEMIGEGGILLSTRQLETWVDAIRSILDAEEVRRCLSLAALAHAQTFARDVVPELSAAGVLPER